MSNLTPSEALVKLDRKISRALVIGKGIRLEASDLELLASLGMIEQLADSKAKALKEQARCRQLRVASINEASSGSILSEAQMANQQAIAGTSGGMMPPLGGSSAKARAQRMFG